MDGNSEKFAELLLSLAQEKPDDSRATSPGAGPSAVENMEDKIRVTRNRPRTFPYTKYLPYKAEDEVEREKNLEEILKHLYIAVEAGDFSVGAAHWTRELRNWLALKFDLTKQQRIKLVKLYYELALAPGVDISAVERFSSTFNVLLKSAPSLLPQDTY